MKILYYQDSHIKGVNSTNRVGNYYEEIMNKIQEVHDIAKENNCDKIIHGGDVWENPVVSNLMVDDFIDIVENTGIPLYVVWGNHDQIGQNIETSKGSSLAHCFRRSNLIKPLTNLKGGMTEIRGFDYLYGVEDDIRENGLIFEDYPDLDVFKIAIVHAFITPKPFLPEVSHICCDDIKTNADLVLVAHYHNQWEKKIGNTTFLDIGCLGRLNSNEHSIKPSVCLIDTEKKSWDVIELKCAKKGSEVFDLEKHKLSKMNNKNLESFVSSLKESKFQDLNITDMIQGFCKQNKISKEIENKIIGSIS